MKVKDRLAGCPAVRLDEAQPREVEGRAQLIGDDQCGSRDGRGIVGGEAPDIGRVPSRDDERVADGRGMNVQERHRVVVLIHHVGGHGSRRDATKDAVHSHDSRHTPRRLPREEVPVRIRR